MGGRRVKVERPRARSVDGHELSLPSWQAWSARDPLDERAFEQMVLGVLRAVMRARWRHCRTSSKSTAWGRAR